jgi:hypothetical protein
VNPEVTETLIGLLSMVLFVIVCYVIWLIAESNR